MNRPKPYESDFIPQLAVWFAAKGIKKDKDKFDFQAQQALLNAEEKHRQEMDLKAKQLQKTMIIGASVIILLVLIYILIK